MMIDISQEDNFCFRTGLRCKQGKKVQGFQLGRFDVACLISAAMS